MREGKEGPRYSVVPADACYDQNLSHGDLRILLAIGHHTDRAGWCHFSQGKLAARLGLARETVNRSTRKLVEAGYLQKYDMRIEGRGNLCRYRILMDRPEAPEVDPEDDKWYGGELGNDPEMMAAKPRHKGCDGDGVVTSGGHNTCDAMEVTTLVTSRDHNTTTPSLTTPIPTRESPRGEVAANNGTCAIGTEKAAAASGEDFSRHVIRELAELINPAEPQAAMGQAAKTIDHNERLHGRETVKRAWSRLQGRALSGEIFHKPGVILGRICEDIAKEPRPNIPIGAIELPGGGYVSRWGSA